MYRKYIKRVLDFFCSLVALVILSPILLVLSIMGAIFMRGNPFFLQERPGKNEKIFKMIKFRTMDNRRDKDGQLLPDKDRLNKYGRVLRFSSLDELPELINILIGDMSLVGPRPLLVEYLPYYTEKERKRHSVRPGLTGLAQINGRNTNTWEKIFDYDLIYINNISLVSDVKILLRTVEKVFKKSDIIVGASDGSGRLDVERVKLGDKND